ncbi:MAG: TetR/AcrR family transcriptional regulator [Acidobacteria bacterium]|nr:TetR/AcrR family transcriptional regulator [Acidobacteriota bacterium]
MGARGHGAEGRRPVSALPAGAPAGRGSGRRRAAILNAALACFLERGVAAATIEDIRERSGASTGSIYHHFESKEDIAGTLYLESLCAYQAGFLGELERHRRARAGVRAVVRFHLRWVEDNRATARYLMRSREPEVARASERALRDLNRAFLRTVSAWLAPHVEAGEIGDLPVDLLISLWLGPAQEFARHRLAGRATTPAPRAARALADAAWRAIRRETP